MPSIRVRLLQWLIGPILLVNLAGGALTYALAWLPAQQAFDQGLLDAAGALAARLAGQGPGLHLDLPPQAQQVLRSDPADAVYFAVRGPDGRLLAGDPDFPTPAPREQAFDAAMRDEPVRMVLLRRGEATVGVAKTLRQRKEARAAIVRALVLLEALFTALSIGLIWYSVSNGLRPLHRLRAALKARAADDLSPVPTSAVPDELEPVVVALNGLLERAGADASARQNFLADMAHQLRTPLAGLRVQLDVLAGRHADPDSARALEMMRAASERMTRQVNQLLALARAEPSRFERTRLEPLALDGLLAETIRHFVEQAARKDIDLGFELAPTTVRGDRFLLRDLVDNLVDNALRYTPAGGTVTVACRQDGDAGVFTVEDSGPGIPRAPAGRVQSLRAPRRPGRGQRPGPGDRARHRRRAWRDRHDRHGRGRPGGTLHGTLPPLTLRFRNRQRAVRNLSAFPQGNDSFGR